MTNPEKIYTSIHETLQKLMGLHRQLLELVRQEREALVAADVRRVEEATHSKQVLIEAIRVAELERLKLVSHLAMALKRPAKELTLPQLIVLVQGDFPKLAEQLRTAYNMLTVLIKRITEQNKDNQSLVEMSLLHVQEMKGNVLREAAPKAGTYTARGKRAGGAGGSRLFQQEA